MSIAEDVSALLAESVGDSDVNHEQTVDRALREVKRLIEPVSLRYLHGG